MRGRARSYIQIEGLFDTEVLGTFNIIRGFASLQDLARISVPVFMHEDGVTGEIKGHQRDLDPQHAEDVKRYFDSGDQRFIPEIILSVRANTRPEMNASNSKEQLGVNYDEDGLIIKRKHSSRTLRIHTLTVKLSKLDELKKATRIRRIDGNHRLAFADQLKTPAGQENKFKVPFCLLLLNEPTDAANNYTEALIFHTINSTAKPLDAEQSLKLILGQSAAYTMPAKREFEFAPALHFTRLLHEKLLSLPEPARGRMGERTLSRVSVASKELMRSYPKQAADLLTLEKFADSIIAALADLCTHLYADFPDFCRADYFLELAAHAWMRHSGVGDHSKCLPQCRDYLHDMAHWMGQDGLRGLRTDKPLGEQLIKIYDSVRNRIPKRVFLARWYPTDKDGEQKTRAQLRLEQLKALVEKEFKLELIDLGTEEGGTELIHPKMYSAVESSEIIIADLTGHRPNVMIELGYALKQHEKGRMLLLLEPIQGHEKPPFDVSSFRYELISQAAEIPGALRKHIKAILGEASIGMI